MKFKTLITEQIIGDTISKVKTSIVEIKKSLLEQLIIEGVDDPGILKCVFMAGGPGSGKSFVSQEIFGIDKQVKASFSSTGLKAINSDTAYMALLKKTGIDPTQLFKIEKEEPELWDKIAGGKNSLRAHAKQLTDVQKKFFEEVRLGMIIDGTAHDLKKITDMKNHAEKLGYDTYMVFVNTTLEVAKLRNLARGEQGERVLPEYLVVNSWKEVQDNLSKLQSLFGGNFRIIDNTSYDLKDYVFKEKQTGIKRVVKLPIEQMIRKEINSFMSRPIMNPVGKKWIETARALKNKNLIK